MKKKELNATDKLDSIVISKTMNLEKNLPLVILEIELSFEIKNTIVEMDESNLVGTAIGDAKERGFQYMFFDSIQQSYSSSEVDLDSLQKKMGNLTLKDTYSSLFNKNFMHNEYLSRYFNLRFNDG